MSLLSVYLGNLKPRAVKSKTQSIIALGRAVFSPIDPATAFRVEARLERGLTFLRTKITANTGGKTAALPGTQYKRYILTDFLRSLLD